MPLELHFPRLLEGGGHAIAPGVILPPGMKLRNPAFLKPRHFRSTLTETLLVWEYYQYRGPEPGQHTKRGSPEGGKGLKLRTRVV